jgi:sterol desaturase/sphingolipid hydroxylase (fatty acid hydroxylase superfamily)
MRRLPVSSIGHELLPAASFWYRAELAMDWKSEATWRLASFIGVLIVMSIWESLLPRRRTTVSRPWRALNNLALAVLNTLAVRMLPVLSAVAAAGWAERHSIGLLHLVDWPAWSETVLTLLALDLLIYGQHVASHKFPMFWRFHRVHHADLDLDATSGLRFHTVEILISMAIKCVAAILLGIRPTDVVLFEIILNATAVFNHSNIRLPIVVDRILRLFVVTPDMHRVHHSVERDETNTNYGFNLPWWDRIFRTYRGQPRGDHETLPLGLPEYQDPDTATRLSKLLRMPFGR